MLIAVATGVIAPAVGLQRYRVQTPAVATGITVMPVWKVAGGVAWRPHVQVDDGVTPAMVAVGCAWQVPAATAVPLVVTVVVPLVIDQPFWSNACRSVPPMSLAELYEKTP